MKQVRLPADRQALEALEAGDEVLLSGEALTMRDAALGRLAALVERGEQPPFALAGQLVFHAGPTPAAAGRPAGAIGPTTSARMDHFLPLMFESGAVATLGKGPRGAEAPAMHAKYRTVYFAAVGGLGALLAAHVTAIEPVAWEELGAEGVKRVTLEDFPATVAIDSRGRDFHAEQYQAFRSDGEGNIE